ncbi:phosphatidylinositol-3,5-bisphosphate 5-phosphatase [Coelomomyces lativittatus]|nr:phosphatidylinositol-3,5-bisphosphate 5-phosphatase [Coelomomyces lativittatus]KAJ1516968.1 phosphatidylinositol-3,5-bisphosphate 5-phosphatase [Coelomomyces lativittatus]
MLQKGKRVTRFLEGYYLITIIRTTRWILLGSHTIYRVDETRLIPLANPSLVKIPKKHEEQQYLTAFQTLILQHDFYFSPTYDLSKTLQCNVLKRSGAPCSFCSSLNPHLLTSSMYTWNSFLIQLAMQTQSSSLDPAWFVTLIQGFIGQIQMDLLGRRVYVTLIARRSRKFAGARFLRRGLDGEGYVANEVETEQIVHLPTFEFPLFETKKTTTPLERCPLCDNHGIASDGTTRVYSHSTKKFIKQPCFTSFVQHRGSIPLLWSQENGTITPKPPITLNIRDPYFVGASLHFNRMLEHYGTPIIILNLIKSKESFKREAILGEEFEVAIKYLNQFLGFHEQLEYHHVDMSHHAKSGRVMDILEAQVEKMVDKVGFFANSTEPILHAKARGNNYLITGRRQSGVIRTNCIDCLDRTNAAAFVIGKAALERQLLHLGILDTPQIDFDSEAVSLLMNLYQEHGDAIAFQYAGSNLVNTMSTYRKGNFVSQSRDLLETIKRYYSSSFTDSEKQDTIDIFLGLGKNNYKPSFKKIKHESYHSNWRKHSDPLVHIPRMDLTASEENIANGALEYVSLVEILGRECPSSQTDSPFKTRSYNESTMYFFYFLIF